MTTKCLYKSKLPINSTNALSNQILVLLYMPLCNTVTLFTKKRAAVPISYYYLIGTAAHGT